MELTFLRGTSRLFNGTFDSPAGPLDENGVESSAPRPMYRVFTTKRWCWQPLRTTITFIGSENPEEHREVAQILWSWPSQNRSYVVRQGRVYSLNEFMSSKGCFNSDSVMTLGSEDYTWRTHMWEPQCYNSKDEQVVTYKREYSKTHPRRRGHLKFSQEIAEHPDKLDAMLVGFWLFKVCRDVHFPWKRKYVPGLLGAVGAKVDPLETQDTPPLPEGVLAKDFCEKDDKMAPGSKASVGSPSCCSRDAGIPSPEVQAQDEGEKACDASETDPSSTQPEIKSEDEKPAASA